MFGDVIQFIGDLVDNWAAFMTGGIPVAVLAFWERWHSRNVSFRFYVAVFLGVGLAAASFQTWRQEHSAKIQAEQLVRQSRSAAISRQLQSYYAEASQFQREAAAVAGIGSEEEYNALKKEIDLWGKETGAWILQNLGEAAYHRVIQSEGLPNMNTVSSERTQLMLVMSAIRDNLGKLLESPAWDRP
jgi:hypothetical protein